MGCKKRGTSDESKESVLSHRKDGVALDQDGKIGEETNEGERAGA